MPLKVIVVGAGLGGLGAAIALTRAGHDVEIFERSSFGNEVGAAIHIAPNATRILRAWNMDLSTMSPSNCTHISAWSKSGDFLGILAVAEELKTKLGITEEWFLVYRVDLHKSLWEQAEKGAHGRRAKVHISCPVLSVDAENGRVTLEDGREYQADLLIGADGLHSKTVHSVDPGASAQISTGQACYRFLIPTEKVERNPVTRKLLDKVGLQSTIGFTSDQRRLVMYPCRSGRLLNLGAFVPERQNKVGESSWLSTGSHEDLVGEFQDFCYEVQELCRMAEDLKYWNLVTRDPPKKFYQGRLVLVGDAAHPTLPHQGQGGAQAFEDAAALGALFTGNTTTEQIDQKLQMYNSIRYKHAVTMMFMSRVTHDKRDNVLEDLKKFVPDAVNPTDMWQFAWTSHPIKVAEEALSSLDVA